jgi:hypothetical protein
MLFPFSIYVLHYSNSSHRTVQLGEECVDDYDIIIIVVIVSLFRLLVFVVF